MTTSLSQLEACFRRSKSRGLVLLAVPEARAKGLEHALKDRGLAVAVSPNGYQAICEASRNTISALVVAADLEGVPGLEVVCALRRKDPAVPVVFLDDGSQTGVGEGVFSAEPVVRLQPPYRPSKVALTAELLVDLREERIQEGLLKFLRDRMLAR